MPSVAIAFACAIWLRFEPAAVALVGECGVGIPVKDHHGGPREPRLDQFRDQLGSGGLKEKQLRDRYCRVTGDRSDALTKLCSTRLTAGEH